MITREEIAEAGYELLVYEDQRQLSAVVARITHAGPNGAEYLWVRELGENMTDILFPRDMATMQRQPGTFTPVMIGDDYLVPLAQLSYDMMRKLPAVTDWRTMAQLSEQVPHWPHSRRAGSDQDLTQDWPREKAATQEGDGDGAVANTTESLANAFLVDLENTHGKSRRERLAVLESAVSWLLEQVKEG